MTGVFITKGMALSVPAGGLKLASDIDGHVTGSLSLHVRFDVCPTWVDLALRHLEQAKMARSQRDDAWRGTNEIDKGVWLEREFESSMQAIMAAAIAVDAFYASIQPHVSMPAELTERWRKKGTARYAQIAEVLRRAFRLKPNGTAALRQNLKEIFRLRDLAVHPKGKLEAPIEHPELHVGVEWRFAYFRAHNAELLVRAAGALCGSFRIMAALPMMR